MVLAISHFLHYLLILQASELRYNELVTQVPESTRPLLRQIEAMQVLVPCIWPFFKKLVSCFFCCLFLVYVSHFCFVSILGLSAFIAFSVNQFHVNIHRRQLLEGKKLGLVWREP